MQDTHQHNPELELRIDPLSGSKSIIAPARADRPGSGFQVDPPAPIDPAKDPFAEGNEDRTPPELYAVRPNGSQPNTSGWKVRVVPNLYPALDSSAAEPDPHPNPDLFAASRATGSHEVVIHSPDSVSSLTDLDLDQVKLVVATWRQRMQAHPEAACLHMIVNERKEAGASLPHSHGQLYAFDFVPAAIARERERFAAYSLRTQNSNLLGDLVREEVRIGERVVAIDDEAVLLAPHASRSPFQLMLVPRTVSSRFQDEGPLCAGMLHEGLLKLRRLFGAPPPLNLWVRTAPRGAENFCWRIDILPRLSRQAGLELGSEIFLCTTSPEQAAAMLANC